MLAPYSPLDFVEALAKERRTDPRVLAAHGTAVPARRGLRRNLGQALVRFGRMIAGNLPDTAAKPA